MHFGYHAIFPNMADEMNQVWKKRTTNFDSIEKMTGKNPGWPFPPRYGLPGEYVCFHLLHVVYNTKVTSVQVGVDLNRYLHVHRGLKLDK